MRKKFKHYWVLGLVVAVALPYLAWATSERQITFDNPYFAKKVTEKTAKNKQTPSAVKQVSAEADATGVPTIYGSLIYCDSWLDLSQSEYPYGIYSFPAQENMSVSEVSVNSAHALTGALVGDEYYVVTRTISSLGQITELTLHCYNTSTWTEEVSVELEKDWSAMPVVMTYDKTDNKIYALSYSENYANHVLATMDPDTGELTTVADMGSTSSFSNIYTMSAGADGKIYAICADGKLYNLDKATGVLTAIGSTGVMPQALQSTVYDYNTHTLYWAASLTDGSGKFYKVDTTTGVAAKISDFPDNEEFVGLFILDEEVNLEAPEAPEAEFVFDSEGALNGKLTVVAPTKNAGGETLTDMIDINVMVDDEYETGVVTLPGGTNEFELTFEEGTHLISVSAIGNDITSKETYINVYAGKDSPKAVENLKLNISTSGMATLTWDAVKESVHGGYMPIENLTYRVTRHDGTVAAEALTANSFSEQLTEAIADYAYTVVPVVGEKEGVAVTSEAVRYGSYYALPYFNDFEDYTEVNQEYTFLNNNGDDTYYVWQCQYNSSETGYALIYYCSWSVQADDYAVTPKIKFDNDNLYKMTFKHSVNNEWSNYINNVKVFAGKEATAESLTVELADFKDLGNGTGEAELIFALPDDDLYHLAFYIYSQHSQGSFWIDDLKIESVGSAKIPGKVSLELTSNDVEPESVELKFIAPDKDASGNALTSLSKIKIYRGTETEPCHTVDNPTKGETYTWTDETPLLGFADYTAVAENEYGESMKTTASVFVGGYETPYVETFDEKDNFDLFTVIDNNADNTTWVFNNGTAKWTYNYAKDADDWLISPKVKFKKGRVYKVSFVGKSNDYYAEAMDLTVGTDVTPESHQTILEVRDWQQSTNKTRYGYYIPSESASYHVGFHACSPKGTSLIEIDKLTVRDAMSADAPAAVEDLVITSDETGLLRASLKFVAPTTTANGKELTKLTKINVYRNYSSEPVYTFNSPKVGAELSWTDRAAEQGMNTYTVAAENEEGEGIDVLRELFVGFDQPTEVLNPIAKGDATNANAVISWETPMRGVNGGCVNTENMTYTVYRSGVELASGLTETTFTDEYNYTDKQTTCYYNIKAVAPEGESKQVSTSVVLGSLYTVPFEETFTNWMYSVNPWTSITLEGSGMFGITNNIDGIYGVDHTGLLKCEKWNDEHLLTQFISPKISVADVLNPVFSFWMYHKTNYGEENNVKVYVKRDDSPEIELIGEPVYVKADVAGWVQYKFSLEGYTDCNFLQIVLEGDLYDNKIYLDNLAVKDLLDDNLMIGSIVCPASIESTGSVITTTVVNEGMNTAESYTVELYCNDVQESSQTGENLESGESKEFTFEIVPPSVADAGKTRNYYTKVVYDKDMKASDDVSEIINAVVATPPYPTISDLSANVDGEVVNLAWSEPDKSYFTPITDGFDEYTVFDYTELGNWTPVDVDKQMVVAPRANAMFTDCFLPKAWQVGEAQRMGMSNDAKDVAARSGSYFLFSMSSDGTLEDGTSAGKVVNDDWLISEEIVGGTDLTFYAKQPTNIYGNEKFEVLYSATDQETSSFILIEEVEITNMAEWNEYSYTLPEDAKYFAIRHTQSNFGLWLDDVTYYPMSQYVDMNIEGYNIYRDGVKVGESATTSFSETGIDGTFKYAVSTQFDLGESALSNEVEIKVVNLSVDEIDGGNPAIGSCKHLILISNADGMSVEICKVDGTLIYSAVADGETKVPVESGIYVVRAGKAVKKVNVR